MKKRYVVSTIVELNVKGSNPEFDASETQILAAVKKMSIDELADNSEIEPYDGSGIIDNFIDETERLEG